MTVVISWRGACSHRVRALEWALDQYAEHHPLWRVDVAEAPAGEWCKARAVMPAVERSETDIVLVADADVWCDEIGVAVAAVEYGMPWAIPHRGVHRLSEAGTNAVLRAEPWGGQELAERAYLGVQGGGIVVARRETLLEVPLDPRFEGWGQEDESHGMALRTLAGEPWRGTAPLVHLFHPPQPRVSRRRGSYAGWQLRNRYAAAAADPNLMRDLVEGACVALNLAEQAVHDHAA